MVQMPAEAHLQALRRLLLRLDDGSVVGAATKLNAPGSAHDFALVSAAQAYGLGRLTDADVKRAQFMLQELHGKVPDAEPLPSLSGGSGHLKRKTPDTLEAPPVHPRKQSLAGRERRPSSRVSADAPSHSGRSASPPLSGGWSQSDFKNKCLDMEKKVRKHLKSYAIWFDHPVERQYARDYYDVIKNPMDLGHIRRTLLANQYRSPHDFAADMRLVWSNCHLYNKADSEVGAVGINASKYFEDLWANSGLDQAGALRNRRSNAGVAALKYEPDQETEQRSRGNGPPSGSKKKATQQGPMPREKKEHLAAILSFWSEQDHIIMEELGEVLRDMQGQEEQVELDFDDMDDATLWRLDAFVQRNEQHVPNDLRDGQGGEAQATDGHFHEQEPESNSEDEYDQIE